MFEHPDAQALYRAILAAPDDDAPRLILADWLDENGQPERAEFIRLECAIDRDPFADATYTLHQRRNELLRQANYAFQRTPPMSAGVGWGYNTVRGFCDTASFASVAALGRQWKKVGKLLPITNIAIRNNKPIEELAKWPHLGQIRGLSFPGNYYYLSDQASYALFTSSHWKHLDQLDIGSGGHATGYLANLLGNTMACSTLRRLRLGYHHAGGLDHLPELAKLEHLIDFDLGAADTTPVVFAKLVEQPSLRWQRLNLGHEFGDEYIRLLLESPAIQHIKSFECNITNQRTFYRLVDAPLPPNVRELRLDIHANFAGDTLTTKNDLCGLEHLWNLTITNVFVQTDFVTRIIRSPYTQNLKQLTIQHVNITDSIAEEILAWPHLPKLDFLSLNMQAVSPKYREALDAKVPGGVHRDATSLYR